MRMKTNLLTAQMLSKGIKKTSLNTNLYKVHTKAHTGADNGFKSLSISVKGFDDKLVCIYETALLPTWEEVVNSLAIARQLNVNFIRGIYQEKVIAEGFNDFLNALNHTEISESLNAAPGLMDDAKSTIEIIKGFARKTLFTGNGIVYCNPVPVIKRRFQNLQVGEIESLVNQQAIFDHLLDLENRVQNRSIRILDEIQDFALELQDMLLLKESDGDNHLAA